MDKIGSLKKQGVFITLGFIYYIWIRVTSIHIPCIFRHITGYLCPGCGITTLSLNLIHGHVKEAFQANPFIFITLPFIIGEIIGQAIREQKGRKESKYNKIILCLYLISFIIFGICRNIIPK